MSELADLDFPVHTAKTWTQYTFSTPQPGEELDAARFLKAFNDSAEELGAVLNAGAESLHKFWRFPNGSFMFYDTDKLVSYHTAGRNDPRQLVQDEFAGHVVMHRIGALYEPEAPLKPVKRTGWETGDESLTSGYEKRFVISRSEVGKLNHSNAQALLATWFAVKNIVFGTGIVGEGFRFGQKAAGIGTVTAEVLSLVHGKKLMYWLSNNLLEGSVRFLAEDAHTSARLTELSIGASDLILRLLLDPAGKDEATAIPRLQNPLQALHTVSADTQFNRTLLGQREGRAAESFQTKDILRTFGEAGLRLARRVDLPSADRRAANLLLTVADALPDCNLAEGRLAGLETQLHWAVKYHRLFNALGKNPNFIRSKISDAVMEDIKFDILGGIGTKFWQRMDAAIDPRYSLSDDRLIERLRTAA